jgi:hypothetical protein
MAIEISTVDLEEISPDLVHGESYWKYNSPWFSWSVPWGCSDWNEYGESLSTPYAGYHVYSSRFLGEGLVSYTLR